MCFCFHADAYGQIIIGTDKGIREKILLQKEAKSLNTAFDFIVAVCDPVFIQWYLLSGECFFKTFQPPAIFNIVLRAADVIQLLTSVFQNQVFCYMAHGFGVVDSGICQSWMFLQERDSRNFAGLYPGHDPVYDLSVCNRSEIQDDTIEVFQTWKVIDVVFSLIIFFVFTEVSKAVEDIEVCVQLVFLEVLPVTDDPGTGDVALPSVSDKCYFFIVKIPCCKCIII